MKKRFLCKIGFHSLFNDTELNNLGTKERPVLFATTYDQCEYCEYRKLKMFRS